MRPGGGKEKGSNFERLVGRQLSYWLSAGDRGDLFARNVLSGGAFTNAQKKGSDETGLPGDLAANSPQAFKFLEHFSVECKHVADLQLEGLLFDWKRTTFLSRTLERADAQAKRVNAWGLVVARQNRRPTVMFCTREAGALFLGAPKGRGQTVCHHLLLRGQYILFDFEQALGAVPAKGVLELAARAKEDI